MERWMQAAVLAAAAAATGLSLGGIRDLPLKQTERKLLLLRWALAAAIGVDVGALLLMARALALACGFWGETALTVGCLILTAAALLRPLSLFPEDSGALMLSDQSQQRRFTSCLLRMAAAFLFYGGWLVFLLCTAPASETNAAALGFAAAALLGLLWNGRQSIRSAYERIETLVDRQYQSELLNFMQVIRSQRHDFNFHMQAVAGMIESGRYEECSSYVREMVKNVEQLNDVLPLKNPVIGALVNAFQELAASRGVKLEVQVLSQLEDLPCTTYEINSVLGNLLQNAIDEAEDKPPEDRWVRLLIMKRSRRHIIKVSNPCGKEPKDYENVFRVGYSTKQSHEGIGLVSVRKITVKYGGAVYLEHDPGIVHFIAKIPEKPAAQA